MSSGQLSDSSSNSSVIEPPVRKGPPPRPPKLPRKKPTAKVAEACIKQREFERLEPLNAPSHHAEHTNLAVVMLRAVREWLVTQGLWWGASAITHAVVLASGLLIFGTVVAHEKIHSTAPAFEPAGGIDTVLNEPPDIDDGFPSDTGPVADASPGGPTPTFIPGPAPRVAGPAGTGLPGGGNSPAVGKGPTGRSGGPGRTGTGGPIGGETSVNDVSIKSIIQPFGKSSTGSDRVGRRPSNVLMGGFHKAHSVEDAVDGVLKGIQREMEAGDLLVVWLVDASISLLEDRQKVADRIEPFYREIEHRGKGLYRLQNAVVAFGDTSIEAVKPTSYSSKITGAIRDLPVDGSGKENVMTAVRDCMNEYGRTWKGGMMIIVWTDESGDDILQLEETIHECRKRHAVVNVVGPTAVLGSERGRHHYVDRATNQAFLLPIKRGPDTCLPERLFLPYWWDSPLAPWIQDGVVAAHGVPWYGGPHREGVLSGLGPYALTRLALQTGGQFILLDRKEDRGEFEMANMKRYFPDYSSPEDYVKSVNSSPLRKATSEAVQATYSVVNLWPPTTAFILRRDTHYPFSIYGGYHTPPRFRELLKAELPKQLAHAAAAAEVVEIALAKFPAGGMESDYAGERSARWRAWYDLTRGRLLAMSIRTLEYRLACERIWSPGFLLPETNSLSFKPSATHLSGEVSDVRAREAIRLLTRCQNENEGTPWARLAEWELQHSFGIAILQKSNPPPPPRPPSPPPPPAPKIVFPPL